MKGTNTKIISIVAAFALAMGLLPALASVAMADDELVGSTETQMLEVTDDAPVTDGVSAQDVVEPASDEGEIGVDESVTDGVALAEPVSGNAGVIMTPAVNEDGTYNVNVETVGSGSADIYINGVQGATGTAAPDELVTVGVKLIDSAFGPDRFQGTEFSGGRLDFDTGIYSIDFTMPEQDTDITVNIVDLVSITFDENGGNGGGSDAAPSGSGNGSGTGYASRSVSTSSTGAASASAAAAQTSIAPAAASSTGTVIADDANPTRSGVGTIVSSAHISSTHANVIPIISVVLAAVAILLFALFRRRRGADEA